MKIRLLLMTIMALLLSCQGLMAGQADDFKVDIQLVQDEFADLNRLEQTVVESNYKSLLELKSDNLLSAEFANMNLSSRMLMDSALGIPGFWWGCVFGIVGVLIVYLVTDNDRAEVKSAFTGCIVSTAVSAVFYLIWYLAWASAI